MSETNDTRTVTQIAEDIASARENMDFDGYVALIESYLIKSKLQGFRECADLVGKKTNLFTSDLERELRRRGWSHEPEPPADVTDLQRQLTDERDAHNKTLERLADYAHRLVKAGLA